MFESFTESRVALPNRVTLRVRQGGQGPAVLLLHGYPQTSACWHLVAPQLVAAGYTVIAPDLRGYGGSDKPATDAAHAPYSKRAMAQDLALLMTAMGHDRFHLVGHDRGGRVAHRLVLDHANRVRSLSVLDIAPTTTMYAQTDMAFARGYYHWFFLIQPAPLPERLIRADPEFFLRTIMKSWGKSGEEVYHPDALAEYIQFFSDPNTIHTTCEDYRAAATIDLEHDTADEQIACPVLALWGAKGLVGQLYDVVATWQEKAADVRGQGLPCGHFLPEEQPDATARALIDFFETQ